MAKILIVLLFMFQNNCATCHRAWKVKHNPDPWVLEVDYVCVTTGRTDDAQVTKGAGGEYSVWSRGAGFGEFETLDQAKKQGEKIVVERNYTCP